MVTRTPSRANERGAAVFVVVMVLSMLTAIGIFAMRAASMTGAASGYERQSTQNHYVGEFGILATATELGTTRRKKYLDNMRSETDTCVANAGLPTTGKKPDCYHVYAKEVGAFVAGNFSGRPLFEPSSGSGSTLVPGSLGPVPLDGDFVIELIDAVDVGRPVSGDAIGSGSAFMQVTLSSIGQVRPSSDPASCAAGAVVAGNEAARAYVVIGPITGAKNN